MLESENQHPVSNTVTISGVPPDFPLKLLRSEVIKTLSKDDPAAVKSIKKWKTPDNKIIPGKFEVDLVFAAGENCHIFFNDKDFIL